MVRTRINGAAAKGHRIALSLRAAYLAMHRGTEALLYELGVTADQFVILAALAQRSALTQRELAHRTASDPNTVRAMLLLLERRGLVARRPHHTDARARTVALTARGRRAFRQLWKRSEPVRVMLTRTLGADNGNDLLAALERITCAFAPPDQNRTSSHLRQDGFDLRCHADRESIDVLGQVPFDQRGDERSRRTV